MLHDECKHEQLWTLIQKRKQSRSGHESAASNPTAIDTCSETDAALVDVLYQTLRNQESSSGTDGAHARLLLQGAIAADSTARPASRPARRGFWNLTGRKQLLLVAALLLITIAAIAFIAWVARNPDCGIGREPAGAITATPSCEPPPAVSKAPKAPSVAADQVMLRPASPAAKLHSSPAK